MVVPYVLATALAQEFRTRYNVVAPDLARGESAPSMQWDAVLALSIDPIPKDISPLVVRLPNTSFDDPVMVTVNDRTIALQVDAAHPIDDVLALFVRYFSSSL